MHFQAPRVPPGFPPLAAADGQTTRSGSLIAPRTEADDQTASPGGQTALKIEAGGQTVSPSGQTAPLTDASNSTAKTCAAPLSPASPTSTTPMRCSRLWLCPTWCPRLDPRHARSRRRRLRPHHPRLQHPSPTHSTTRVALGLCERHRHLLYISSHHR
jgi:hypothetical protein